MNCSEIKYSLAIYSDGLLDPGESEIVKVHLVSCPNCRQRENDIRRIRSGLNSIGAYRPAGTITRSVKDAVASERRAADRSWLPVSTGISDWLRLQVMPFGVGVFATVLIGFTLLTALFSVQPRPVAETAKSPSTSFLADNRAPYSDDLFAELSPAEYANTRLNISSQSPSVNPRGALIALTKSFIRGGMKDDEVVVVAEVFGDGLAKITEIVEPSRDRMAVRELEKALKSDPDFAPFVPASMENRPDKVRVVLRLQNVDVSTRSASDQKP